MFWDVKETQDTLYKHDMWVTCTSPVSRQKFPPNLLQFLSPLGVYLLAGALLTPQFPQFCLQSLVLHAIAFQLWVVLKLITQNLHFFQQISLQYTVTRLDCVLISTFVI